MTIQELGLLAKLKLPVKIFIMDNGCLGMVRQWQELFFEKHYSQSILDNNPDFIKIAEAYGLPAGMARRACTLSGQIQLALAVRGPLHHPLHHGSQRKCLSDDPGRQDAAGSPDARHGWIRQRLPVCRSASGWMALSLLPVQQVDTSSDPIILIASDWQQA